MVGSSNAELSFLDARAAAAVRVLHTLPTPVLYDRSWQSAAPLAVCQLPLMACDHQFHLILQSQFHFFQCNFLLQVF